MNFNWLLGLAVLGCKLAKGGDTKPALVDSPLITGAKEVAAQVAWNHQCLRESEKILQDEAEEAEIIMAHFRNMNQEDKTEIITKTRALIKTCYDKLTQILVQENLLLQLTKLKSQMSTEEQEVLQTKLQEYNFLSDEERKRIQKKIRRILNKLIERERDLE
ncbi:hypothetical protein BdWA1_000632 [Babesia duncani]|uniref:Uncharacterized protein n=1 Tax=Babesia duncani TaxID=323732 RepID=A0AAD9UME7_9APIC|nr:hypothetical protein BdWA1_003958 [Babesia duncani]KAK2197629.1 hypothetical protein BdWA1_000632 [Babesia duncani]